MIINSPIILHSGNMPLTLILILGILLENIILLCCWTFCHIFESIIKDRVRRSGPDSLWAHLHVDIEISRAWMSFYHSSQRIIMF